jgi:FkbM family methyltransferase
MVLSGRVRRSASAAKRWLFPSAEISALRHACRLSERTPRHQRGEIALNGYRIVYPDLLTLCPQWEDIFVNRSLWFQAESETPRVLDCGANVGLASLYFKRLYPRARITAYEADPALAALCEENLQRNGAADVAVHAAAVWTSGGTVTFNIEGTDSGAIEHMSAGLVGRPREVPAVRLRDVIAEAPVDLLKLDIEGAEHAVLTDCAGVLDGVRAILLDLHEFDPAHRQTPAIFRLLEQAGFVTSVVQMCPLPWRRSSEGGPFPGSALAWASTVRAWRP